MTSPAGSRTRTRAWRTPSCAAPATASVRSRRRRAGTSRTSPTPSPAACLRRQHRSAGGQRGPEVVAAVLSRADGALDPDGGAVLAAGLPAAASVQVAFDGTRWLAIVL